MREAATASATGSSATTGSQRRRWYVHLALMVSYAGSLVSLIWLSHSITVHVVIGVVFMLTLLAHFAQRRRTIASLVRQWGASGARAGRGRRLALSDAVLELLVLDVLVSGLVDGLTHHTNDLPLFGSLGFPPGLVQWHKLAAVVLTIYAVVHVVRRRRRLRHSSIR